MQTGQSACSTIARSLRGNGAKCPSYRGRICSSRLLTVSKWVRLMRVLASTVADAVQCMLLRQYLVHLHSMIIGMSAPLPCSWQRPARPCSAGAAPQPAACRRQHNAAECPPDYPVLPGSDLCQAAMKSAQQECSEAILASTLIRLFTGRDFLCDTTWKAICYESPSPAQSCMA